MKKLFLNLALLLSLVTLCISVLETIAVKNSHQYLAEAQYKYQILSSTPSPKIILVGGSNLAFSVDSEKIAKQTGISVVNLGLHANLGLKFMIDEIIPFIKEGDIVIIIPEYSHFTDTSLDGTPTELGRVILMCPQCAEGIENPAQVLNVGLGILQTTEDNLRGAFVGPDSGIYRRDGFNSFGDFIGHLNQPSPGLSHNRWNDMSILIPNPAVFFLNAFYQKVKKQNVEVFFMFPGIPEYDYQTAQGEIQKLSTLLHSELKIPVLGTSQDFVFPEEYFYDTQYHMNAIGRQYRTKRMIELINKALQHK